MCDFDEIKWVYEVCESVDFFWCVGEFKYKVFKCGVYNIGVEDVGQMYGFDVFVVFVCDFE